MIVFNIQHSRLSFSFVFVFKARAKQLYAAGFKNLEAIAKAKIKELTDSVEHLTPRVARQLISAAKVIKLAKHILLSQTKNYFISLFTT